VIARLQAGEGRPGLMARCQARIARFADTPWSTRMAAVAVALGVLGIVRGVDVSSEFPGWEGFESPPQLEVVAETPTQPPARSVRAIRPTRPTRLVGTSAEPSPVEVVSPMLECLRAGGPSRSAAGPGDPCAHWDSWMVGLGMRDAPAFVIEVEALPASDRARILARIRDFATRSGSAPVLARTLRSARDPRAASLANHIERASVVSTR
jgi:hypothetical protein